MNRTLTAVFAFDTGKFAISHHRRIGLANGELPWGREPEDLKRFRRLTIGKTCIVGRKTFDLLPPLPGRELIVVSRQGRSLDSAIEEYPEAVVIGGADVLGQAWDRVRIAYVTRFRGERLPPPLETDVLLPEDVDFPITLLGKRRTFPAYGDGGRYYWFETWEWFPDKENP